MDVQGNNGCVILFVLMSQTYRLKVSPRQMRSRFWRKSSSRRESCPVEGDNILGNVVPKSTCESGSWFEVIGVVSLLASWRNVVIAEESGLRQLKYAQYLYATPQWNKRCW